MLIRSLAERGEWELMRSLCMMALHESAADAVFHHKGLGVEDIASIAHCAISESIRRRAGKPEVSQSMAPSEDI
jgi:hypothetical protein